jgi:hypothetical protein
MQEQARQPADAVAVFKLEAGASAPAVSTRPKAAAPVPKAAVAAAKAKSWPEVERRGADRAKNVSRLSAKPAPKVAQDVAAPAAVTASGTADDWTEF